MPPSVSISLFLDNAWLLDKGFIANLRLKGEIGPCSERRVNVDKVHLAGELGQEGGEDVLLVAPDEAVAPLGVLPAAEQVERHLPLLRALVDRLHRLKGERDAQRG